MRKLAAIAVVCGVICLDLALPAVAQERPTNVYAATAPINPSVSPYLNLGVNSNGLSNYQTQVLPLLNERDAFAQQAAISQRLQHQVRQQPGGRGASESNGQAANDRNSGRRFMNYSHYFGGGR